MTTIAHPVRLSFDDAVKPDPSPDAPISEIVDFIEGVVIWNLLADENAGWPDKRELRQWVEHFGYYWKPLAMELRRRRGRGAQPGRVTYTESGIEVRQGVINQMLEGLEPFCPWKSRRVDTLDWRLTMAERPCGTWSCPDCGPRRAEELLAHAANNLGSCQKLYVAEVAWDPKLFNRLAQRRRSSGARTFWYRTIEDRVFIISDRPVIGSDQPTEFTELSSEEALGWSKEAFWVPGHQSHRWSSGWPYGSSRDGQGARPRGSQGDGPRDESDVVEEESPIPPFILLNDLNGVQTTRAMARLRDQAEARFDIRLDVGHAPSALRRELYELMTEIVDDEKERGMAERLERRKGNHA
jgi:hypothetical protein